MKRKLSAMRSGCVRKRASRRFRSMLEADLHDAIEDANDLIEDLGQAFDIAYARYIDRHADFDVFQQLTSGVFA